MRDTEVMTIGNWLDYIITYNEINSSHKDEEETSKATQNDFDAF